MQAERPVPYDPAQDIDTEERAIVAAYARAKYIKDEAAAIEADAKKRAEVLYREQGLAALQGPEGVVTLADVAGSRRLDRKLVARLLTPEQIASCEIEGKGSFRASFKPREVRR